MDRWLRMSDTAQGRRVVWVATTFASCVGAWTAAALVIVLFVLLLPAGPTRLDLVGVAVIGVAAAGLSDVLAISPRPRLYAAAAGSLIGVTISFLVGYAIAAAIGSDLAAWAASGALAVIAAAVLTSLVATYLAAPESGSLWHVAITAGAVAGVTLGAGIGGAIGGVCAVATWNPADVPIAELQYGATLFAVDTGVGIVAGGLVGNYVAGSAVAHLWIFGPPGRLASTGPLASTASVWLGTSLACCGGGLAAVISIAVLHSLSWGGMTYVVAVWAVPPVAAIATVIVMRRRLLLLVFRISAAILVSRGTATSVIPDTESAERAALINEVAALGRQATRETNRAAIGGWAGVAAGVVLAVACALLLPGSSDLAPFLGRLALAMLTFMVVGYYVGRRLSGGRPHQPYMSTVLRTMGGTDAPLEGQATGMGTAIGSTVAFGLAAEGIVLAEAVPPRVVLAALAIFGSLAAGSLVTMWASRALAVLLASAATGRLSRLLGVASEDRPLDPVAATRAAADHFRYRQAIARAAEVDVSLLEPVQRRELAAILWLAASGVEDGSADQIAGFERSAELRKPEGEDPDHSRLNLYLGTLNGLGNAHLRAGQPAAATATWDEVINRTPEPVPRPLIELAVLSRCNRAVAEERTGHVEEAYRDFDAAVALCDPAVPTQRRAAMVSLVLKAEVELGHDLHGEAAATAERAIALAGSDRSFDVRRALADGLLLRQRALFAGRRWAECAATTDEIAMLPWQTDGAVRDVLVRSTYMRGLVYFELGQYELATQLFDGSLDRLTATSGDDAILSACAGRHFKGLALVRLDRPEEATDAFLAAVTRFGDSRSAAVRKWAAKSAGELVALMEWAEAWEAVPPIAEWVVGLFGNDTGAEVRTLLATMMGKAAEACGRLGRPSDEFSWNERLARRFAADDIPEVQRLVAQALARASSLH